MGPKRCTVDLVELKQAGTAGLLLRPDSGQSKIPVGGHFISLSADS